MRVVLAPILVTLFGLVMVSPPASAEHNPTCWIEGDNVQVCSDYQCVASGPFNKEGQRPTLCFFTGHNAPPCRIQGEHVLLCDDRVCILGLPEILGGGVCAVKPPSVDVSTPPDPDCLLVGDNILVCDGQACMATPAIQLGPISKPKDYVCLPDLPPAN